VKRRNSRHRSGEDALRGVVAVTVEAIGVGVGVVDAVTATTPATPALAASAGTASTARAGRATGAAGTAGAEVALREAGRPDVAGDEAVGALVEVRLDDEALEHLSDGVPSHGDGEQEADGVGDEPRREEERARGDEQTAVHDLVRREVAPGELRLEASEGVSPLGADDEHPDESGQDDECDGRHEVDVLRDDHE